MKRDMDLVRNILKTVEQAPPGAALRNLDLAGYDAGTISEHVYMLDKAGYIEGNCQPVRSGIVYALTRLTWEGHEFLDLSANEALWSQLKARAKQDAMGLSVHLLLTGLRLGAAEWAAAAIAAIR